MLATRGPRRRTGRRKRPSSTPAIMKTYSVRARAIAAAGYNDLDSSQHIGQRENDAYNAGWKDVKHGDVAADMLAPAPEPGCHIEKMVK